MSTHRLLAHGRRCSSWAQPLLRASSSGLGWESRRPFVADASFGSRQQAALLEPGQLSLQDRACSTSASSCEPSEELLAQLRGLPQDQQETLGNALLRGTLGETAIGEVPPITRAQMGKLFVATAIPMVGFGFMDNAVMIICGEFIEIKLGAALCVTTLAAAGIGNLISDIVGLGTGGIIEAGAANLGFASPPMTIAQQASRVATTTRQMGSVLGLGFGCTIGMFPLLFHDEDDMRLRTIFGRYDKDGSGSLDWQEIWLAFNDAKMYPSERDMHRLFDKYDLDKDGQIEYNEFKLMSEDLEQRLKEDKGLDARGLMASAALYLEMDK